MSYFDTESFISFSYITHTLPVHQTEQNIGPIKMISEDSANESWLSIRISISLQIWTRPACEYAIWYIKQVDSDQTLDYIFIPAVLHV